MKKLKLKIINSQKKHKQALAAIEQLWDSKPATEEHDALEVLSLLVEDYERRTALAAHSIYRVVPVSSSAPLPHPLPLQSHVSNEDTSSTTTTTKTVTCVTGPKCHPCRQLHNQELLNAIIVGTYCGSIPSNSQME